MDLQTITLGGRDYVIVPREEFNKLSTHFASGLKMPELPPADRDGNRPAVAFARATIARSFIARMNAVSVGQAELARVAGVPAATLNRILKCVRTPDESTVNKIEKALRKREKASR